MTRGYCEICDEEGINGGLSDDVVFSKHHLNNTICRKHHAERMIDTDKRCECCGTTKNVVNKGMWTPAWYCEPYNTCAENKEMIE